MKSFWDIFNPEELIRYGGLALVYLIVFIENGIFFGFFLPGDSFLFTAGLLCYLGVLDVDLAVLLSGISISAVLGYYVGYYFGYKTGEALYKKEDTIFFKKSYLTTAEQFYKKYGGFALIMGRFLPIVRTFAPILSGVVKVDHRLFFIYNIIGGILWPGIIVTMGYYIGSVFPNVLDYISYIIIAFIVVTTIPILNNINKQRKSKNSAA
ncbi:MAG: VTT domain-containing protein [Bacteroidia bacterium]